MVPLKEDNAKIVDAFDFYLVLKEGMMEIPHYKEVPEGLNGKASFLFLRAEAQIETIPIHFLCFFSMRIVCFFSVDSQEVPLNQKNQVVLWENASLLENGSIRSGSPRVQH